MDRIMAGRLVAPAFPDGTGAAVSHAAVRPPSLHTQLIEQRLGVFQIARVEAFGEPAVDRREETAGLAGPALLAPKPGEAGGGAQLPPLGALIVRDGQRSAVTNFGFALILM